MQNILLPISPQSCADIANGNQSIIVKKNMPRIEYPFKCYIYCTKCRQFDSLVGSLDTLFYYPELERFVSFADMERDSINADRLNGKVIGEFVCKKIEPFTPDSQDDSELLSKIIEKSLLSFSDLVNYKGNAPILYGWHISELIIYNQPIEMSDFETIDSEKVKHCQYRQRVYQNPDFNNGGQLYGSSYCKKQEDWCSKCYKKVLQKAPAQWCYVDKITR